MSMLILLGNGSCFCPVRGIFCVDRFSRAPWLSTAPNKAVRNSNMQCRTVHCVKRQRFCDQICNLHDTNWQHRTKRLLICENCCRARQQRCPKADIRELTIVAVLIYLFKNWPKLWSLINAFFFFFIIFCLCGWFEDRWQPWLYS